MYAEKLDIIHYLDQQAKTKTMAPTGYKELTEKQKRAALGALLVLEKDGQLPHGSFAQVGKKLALAPKSIGRLWRAAASTRASCTIQSPEVISKKKGNEAYRKPKLVYDRELMKQEILSIPLWKRSTVRNLAHELKMPRSTLQDILKKEKDEVIHHHTSRLKVNLNEEQMFQRILYCFSMTRWRRTRTRQKCFYHDQMDTIHIDEK